MLVHDLFSDMPIVDAHQHFWDPVANYHPWLCDQSPVPFRYGNYSALRRAYLPQDYAKDAEGHSIAATVYIEAEWQRGDAIKEMRYVEQLRTDSGFPTVAVAQAWLDSPDIEALLPQLASFPFVRGIRHKPRANPASDSDAPGGMMDSAWRRGYAKLADYGLRFDLQAPWWHLHEAAALARDFPLTQIIVNHTGLPADRSSQGVCAWREAIKQVADYPNVALKISGLGIEGQPWTVSGNQEIVLHAIEAFGVDRCMFASNYPVDGLCASFETVFDGFAQIVQGLSHAEKRKLFHDNAIRIYAIR